MTMSDHASSPDETHGSYGPVPVHVLPWVAWCALGAFLIAISARGVATVVGASCTFWSWSSFITAFVISAGWAILYHRSLHYILSDRHLSMSSGVLWQHRRAIPLEKISDIDVRQGPFERLAGLGEVWVFTHSADSGLPEERLIGLRRPDEVKQRVMAQMSEAERQRQSGNQETEAEMLGVLKDIQATLKRLEQTVGITAPDSGAGASVDIGTEKHVPTSKTRVGPREPDGAPDRGAS